MSQATSASRSRIPPLPACLTLLAVRMVTMTMMMMGVARGPLVMRGAVATVRLKPDEVTRLSKTILRMTTPNISTRRVEGMRCTLPLSQQ
jgi:hypothetical protein